MKNYWLKSILSFFIISGIIIIALGVFFAWYTDLVSTKVILAIIIALAILAVFCIAMAIFTTATVVNPMSKMLKGTVLYNDIDISKKSNNEVEKLVSDLRFKLIEANNQKRQTDTILKHMTDGVIAFDMNGKVTYINPAAM